MNNLLKIYSDSNDTKLKLVKEGIEEQGICYEILSLKSAYNLDIKKHPFSLAIIIDNKDILIKSINFIKRINFNVENISNKYLKEVGLDIGRYIKGLPLKGDWDE